MGFTNTYIVQKNGDKWEIYSVSERRVLATASTQAEAIRFARELINKAGGGELQIRGLNGRIREQDTIAPGSDPRRSRG